MGSKRRRYDLKQNVIAVLYFVAKVARRTQAYGARRVLVSIGLRYVHGTARHAGDAVLSIGRLSRAEAYF